MDPKVIERLVQRVSESMRPCMQALALAGWVGRWAARAGAACRLRRAMPVPCSLFDRPLEVHAWCLSLLLRARGCRHVWASLQLARQQDMIKQVC